ncbi:MAG: folate-binding protein YgfZ [Thiopseudomonas sp.]|nr:folate-binding protein YgfZ [Thiopseudomonas sp.]
MSQMPAFTVLDHQGMLSVRGVDAAKFLQGQLTCNLNYVTHDRSSLGARCNPKGRMQSSFRLALQGDGFLLSMARELVERQLADLKKFAVFSKSVLLDESADWLQLGLINAETTLQALGIELPADSGSLVQHNGLLAIRISDSLAELWIPAADGGCTLRKLSSHIEEKPANDWQLEMIRCGIGHITENLYESFIPQLINLPALDGVSFKKGCYTGQEIVARMQYLGKQKRQMQRFVAQGEYPVPASGTALLQAADSSKAGEVVNAARSAEGIEMLAVVQTDSASEHPLVLDIAGQPPLTLATLPYEIDVEREIQR